MIGVERKKALLELCGLWRGREDRHKAFSERDVEGEGAGGPPRPTLHKAEEEKCR